MQLKLLDLINYVERELSISIDENLLVDAYINLCDPTTNIDDILGISNTHPQRSITLASYTGKFNDRCGKLLLVFEPIFKKILQSGEIFEIDFYVQNEWIFEHINYKRVFVSALDHKIIILDVDEHVENHYNLFPNGVNKMNLNRIMRMV